MLVNNRLVGRNHVKLEYEAATVLILLGLGCSLAVLDAGDSGDKKPKEKPARVINVNVPAWDCRHGDPKFVSWRSRIGGNSGFSVIFNDRVLVGTNNENPRDAKVAGDYAVLMCFKPATGAFLWQATHPRLDHRHQDMRMMPIMSRPSIDGQRIYYVSNRGELVCLDLDGRTVWKLDMVSQLGVHKQDATDVGNPISSPLIVGDLVYCVTGNGAEFDRVPSPEAPSFIAVTKANGKVIWTSNAPGKNIIYGQWSSPVFVHVGGKGQVVFPGGDGFLYGFEPLTGKQLWKIDCGGPVLPENGPKAFGKRNFFVATPTVHKNMVYVGPNQFWESGPAPGRPLYAIELVTRAMVTEPRIKWTFDDKDFGGTFGAAAVADDKVYVLSQSGTVFALDAESGKEHWRSELGCEAGLFSSPCVGDGRLYVASQELFVFILGESPRCQGRYYFGGGRGVQGTPAIGSKNTLYMAANGNLWALKLPPDSQR